MVILEQRRSKAAGISEGGGDSGSRWGAECRYDGPGCTGRQTLHRAIPQKFPHPSVVRLSLS